ncbi:MAG: hypothetical protein EOQ28_20815 [Mesorhizobium sp.]|uniref:hypothetical protein n=1 Tax=Mesorhizobium sp. TaxID=1871066 RepID=UPI000FE5C898|nr:hypothetical protein [Mesorhizobium sp.]RWA70451.1 MAG: hypothetical protein EOQ28_20815 [Mesorhizobium sp.]RWK06693.1 MAG: hypothetical protein EOR39_24010 [Mesorhizobium sp.]TIQ42700.1 MAG: hypothetical protein E5X47_31590 [Mesorhizobium sp.]TIQ56497.1 MAG: hypothetical protein E5X46_18655 [Mesorhizobium sp.]
MVFKPAAALAAARTLIVPAVKRPFIFHNSDATYTVTLKSTDGASPETVLTKAVAPGGFFIGYTNGSSPGLYGAVVATSGGALADGDYGDITVSGSGTVMSIDAFSGAAAGNILAYDSASPAGWVKVPAGTSGQFLKSQGAAAPGWSDLLYDVPLSFPGTPTAGQLMGKLIMVRDVSFAANFSGSSGHVRTNPGAQFDIDVKDNGSSIGTISVATNGTFTFTTSSGTAKTVSAGHRLEFYAPSNSPAEATVANIAATLKGTAI